jgi:hypothetical protein
LSILFLEKRKPLSQFDSCIGNYPDALEFNGRTSAFVLAKEPFLAYIES